MELRQETLGIILVWKLKHLVLPENTTSGSAAYLMLVQKKQSKIMELQVVPGDPVLTSECTELPGMALKTMQDILMGIQWSMAI